MRHKSAITDYEDLNRIENWTRFLAGMLSENGYDIFISQSIVYAFYPYQGNRPDAKKHREASFGLQHASGLAADYHKQDFVQVNTLEWDLKTIFTWLSRMVAVFCRLGEFHVSEGVMA